MSQHKTIGFIGAGSGGGYFPVIAKHIGGRAQSDRSKP
jgi:hypothetical protein